MSSHDDLLELSVLEVIAPPPSLPNFGRTMLGIRRRNGSLACAHSADRKAAPLRQLRNADENLDFLLIIRFPSPPDHSCSPPPAPSPPSHLSSFLAYLQITYDTAYIPPVSSSPDLAGYSRLPVPPPRNSSLQQQTAYVGLKTPCSSLPWGASDNRDRGDFVLLWDAADNGWLAVYKMSILIPRPLFSIIVSTALRNKTLWMTAPPKTPPSFIDTTDGLKSAADVTSLVKSRRGITHPRATEHEILSELQEVNWLVGLARETPVAHSTGVTYPPSDRTLLRAATLRNSFRKTLKSMGFRVRVYKPRKAYDPGVSDSDSDLEDNILEEREQREAGNEGHTVVLSGQVELWCAVNPPAVVAGSRRHTIAVFDTPTNNQPPPPSSRPTPTGLVSGQTLNIPNRASFIPPVGHIPSLLSPITDDIRRADEPAAPLPHMNPLAGYTHSQSGSANIIKGVLELPTPRTPITAQDAGGEPMVVSVGLLPAPHRTKKGANGSRNRASKPEPRAHHHTGIQRSTFTLNILAFNSPCGRAGSRWATRMSSGVDGNGGRRSKRRACQSVRVDFLRVALPPGVMDVRSGVSMHLWNVTDIIMREPDSEAPPS
ncbi:hypothetical protein C8Q80DRAFT_1275011 [Daedaleopsis nitida]|nr:hypothetical protein C8Q80DRAFT_1275011 [Daedaleopsis nitida]